MDTDPHINAPAFTCLSHSGIRSTGTSCGQKRGLKTAPEPQNKVPSCRSCLCPPSSHVYILCNTRASYREMSQAVLVYIYLVYSSVCLSACLPGCLSVCQCMYVCMYVCTYIYINTSMYACMHGCMCVCMYVCMYACTYVCMHMCDCVVRVCIHVYTATLISVFMP